MEKSIHGEWLLRSAENDVDNRSANRSSVADREIGSSLRVRQQDFCYVNGTLTCIRKDQDIPLRSRCGSLVPLVAGLSKCLFGGAHWKVKEWGGLRVSDRYGARSLTSRRSLSIEVTVCRFAHQCVFRFHALPRPRARAKGLRDHPHRFECDYLDVHLHR